MASIGARLVGGPLTGRMFRVFDAHSGSERERNMEEERQSERKGERRMKRQSEARKEK